MKRKAIWKCCFIMACFSITLMASTSSPVCYGAIGSVKAEEEDGEKTADIEIGNIEDFLIFVEKCKYDNWSIGKTVSLTADLDLKGVDFAGIAYFNGIFEGNGHSIKNLALDLKGSEYGFFRYIGESGIVRDLHVLGKIVPTGSQENIGGIVGVNYGTVNNCSFIGEVYGINSVGAIAGFNKDTGNIISCTSNALVLATNYTGGIAGNNEGKIADCVSKSSVNIEELEPTLNLAGMDVSSFNMTRKIVNRNDMGGIAGSSSGLITGCINEGSIGYQHTGYNAGGIVGSQCGVVHDCTNKGEVFGRKDVGGIVGQSEPYVESEYLQDRVNKAKDDIDRLNRTLNNITSTMSQTSAEVKGLTDRLNQQYRNSISNISGNIDQLVGAVGNTKPEAQGYIDHIQGAWNSIESIRPSDGKLTEEQAQEIRNQLDTINDNLGNLHGVYDNVGASAEEFAASISNQLSSSGRNEEIKNIVNTVDAGMQSVTKNMESAINQLNSINNSVSSDIAAITSDEKVVIDISSIKTAANMDGVISGCKNYGKIYGDLNVGGIAGTMNVEYVSDPEFDFDFSKSLNITLRSTVNDVVIHCTNYGRVTAKKNCVGGIIGLQALGFLYDCEGYGEVSSDSGSYLGGIAGNSVAAIEKSYSLCNVSGTDYVGGICGKGYTVKESISICDIEGDGERIGSVAGYLEEGGTVESNYFVSEKLCGIDNISYEGTAEQISYEDAIQIEGIPDGFHRVSILFEVEDEVLEQREIAYGASLTVSDFPQVAEKEGCYVKWPEESEFTNIQKNLTITAEYVPWLESIASKEKTQDGKPIFIAVSEFYENTKLVLEPIEGPDSVDKNADLAYAYAWKLSGDKPKNYEMIEAHLIKPETEDNVHVWVRENNKWNEVSAEEDGSYLVITIPYGADVAIVTQEKKLSLLVVLTGIAAVILGAGMIFIKKRKRRGKIT